MEADQFLQAVQDHRDRVYTYAAWLLRDRNEAADITQEAFMRLWQHHQQVASPASRTWLLRTLVPELTRRVAP